MTVAASADGVIRAVGTLNVVVKPPLSNLAMSATPTSVGAGITTVKVAQIPNAWLAFFSGSVPGTAAPPLASPPTASTPVGSVPVGSIPVGSIPVGSIPWARSRSVRSPWARSRSARSRSARSASSTCPSARSVLSSLLLSQLPLCGDVPQPGTNADQCRADGATWAQVLAGSGFEGKPLNALSLSDVLAVPSVKTKLGALPLKDVSFVTTLLKSVHWTSLLLGPAHLTGAPGARRVRRLVQRGQSRAPRGRLHRCHAGHDRAAGRRRRTSRFRARRLDPRRLDPGRFHPRRLDPRRLDLARRHEHRCSRLAAVRIADIAPADRPAIVTCTACQTLGEAYAAGAIVPTVTFFDPRLSAAFTSAGITINDILAAILNQAGPNGLPWETLPLQGLQPYSDSPSHVTYTMSATVDCSVLRSFSFTAKLPQGFFPKAGTQTLALTGFPAAPTGAPTVDGETAADAQELNQYTWHLSCGGANTAVTATLTFDAYVGLKLGTFKANAEARAGDFSVTSDGGVAPVTVTQNGEPGNDTVDGAGTVGSDTLVVGHIPFSGDQDFYNVSLTGLARGTKISAFLHTPTGTDLDLTISKAATPSYFSTPVGSIPVGSIPIEDNGVGFTNPSGALPSDTLQDVPVGSIPVGSIPVGSIPVGSISANRGDANEAAQVITDGTGGVATIGISGYNGAASADGYVLRIKVTPPPPVPATCPARAISVLPANRGTLPASLPTTTKSLFVVNKQRLLAMYDATSVNNLLSALTALAARPEVGGAVLQVDGNAAVQSAYTAWDASPCNSALANNVVRSINDVIAGYRNSVNGLPNLHYIVLTGSDELTPMARTPDPVTLSPEENVAADLAFTTSGLHAGNALYNSAARTTSSRTAPTARSSASRGSDTTCCCRSSPSRASSRPRGIRVRSTGTSSPEASRSPARRRPRPGRSTRRSSSPPATTSSPTARRRCATTCARTSPASPRPRCRTRSADQRDQLPRAARAVERPEPLRQLLPADRRGRCRVAERALQPSRVPGGRQHTRHDRRSEPLDRGDPGADPLHHGLPRRAERRRHARRLRRQLSRLAAGVRQGPGGDVHR